jgi:hypothetical protein
VGPAVFLADNLIHPKEFTRDHEREQLAEIASSYTSWQLAHALGFVAIVVFAAAVAGLAWVVGRRSPRVGLAGGALAVAGLLGLASVLTIDGYTWAILGEVSVKPGADVRTVELALHDVQQSNWSYLYYLTPLGFILGMLVLAIGAARTGLAPTWAAALFGVGILMVGTETAIVSNAYFIAGAGVLLAGGAALAGALLRAAPAPPPPPGSAPA